MAKYQKLDTEDIDLEAAHSPPAYDAPQNNATPMNHADSTLPTPGSSTSKPSATNFISVIHSSTKITGNYTIDTSIAAAPLGRFFPAGSSASTSNLADDGVETANAVFQARSEEIELSLCVKGGRPANIKVEKSQGSAHVWVEIPHRAPSTPLHLHIAGSSAVRVSLPSSFRGPVAGGSKESGLIQFSPAFRELGVSTFSVNQHNPGDGKYFIGEWENWAGANREGGGDNWEGDRLVVTSGGGPVLVQTYEEKEAEEERRLGRKAWSKRVMLAFWNIFVAIGLFLVSLAHLD